MNIKQMPLDDRPREKLLQKGVGALSNAELLAILLRTGKKGRSAVEIARELAGTSEKLLALRSIKPAELALQKGIGPAKAVTIVAAMELGRRFAAVAGIERPCINSIADAIDLLMPQMRHEVKEHVYVLLLNARAQVLCIEQVAQGGMLSAVIEPREIFHAAIMHRAAALILSHNHPSGDPAPSSEDITLTKDIVAAGEVMKIPVIDHIIIGDGKYFSFKEQGYLSI